MEQDLIRKRMRIMLLWVGLLFGSIFIYKLATGLIYKMIMAKHVRIVTVSTTQVKEELWQSKLVASGSLRAIRGVNVTTELAGIVNHIYFTPGQIVAENTLLVDLRNDPDIALLRSVQANAELAKINYQRDKAQYAAHAISKATLDSDEANLKSLNAQVQQQAATVEKKIIRAPFTGRLGISLVNPGQYLNAGDSIVVLQTQDPIYIDFYLPQQSLPQLKTGQVVNVTTDTFPQKIFSGKITTINPLVDVNTRNIEVEATLPNPQYELTPGMFASVEIDINLPKHYLTVPQTAVSYNAYGEIVYVLEHKNKKSIAHEIFVKTGETRGDLVAILKGLKKGDTIVTSGQLKLKNGTEVAINNAVLPSNSETPEVSNDH